MASKRGQGECLAIVLVVLTITATSLIGTASGGCVEMVTMYYQCTQLKMVNGSSGFQPNDTIQGNILDDFKLEKEKLLVMTPDQAIKLISKIYKASQCSSFTCQCIRSGFLDRATDKDITPLLNSTKSLTSIKQFTTALNSDKELSLYKIGSFQIGSMLAAATSPPSPLSIVYLCSKYEISIVRQMFYQYIPPYSNTNLEVTQSWMYNTFYMSDQKVNGPSGITESKFLENMIGMSLLSIKDANAAFLLLNAFITWQGGFPQLKPADGDWFTMLNNQIKRLKGSSTDIMYRFGKFEIISNTNVSILTLKNITVVTSFPSGTKNFTENCLTVKQLTIDCVFTWRNESNSYYISAINMMFTLANAKKPNNIAKYSLSTSNIPSNTYLRTPSNSSNLIYLAGSSEVFEFNTRTTLINIEESSLQMAAPVKILTGAKGLWVDGVFKTKP